MLVRVSQRAAPGQNRARNVGRGKSRIYKGSTGRFLAARRRVLGGWTSGRTRWSSPRSSSSHCTVSPACTPMAAAKAQLNFQTHSRRALRCNILRTYLQEDFRGFAARLADSPLFQRFCLVDEIDKVKVPAKSTLQRYAQWTDEKTLNELIGQALRQAHHHPEKLQLDQPVDLDASGSAGATLDHAESIGAVKTARSETARAASDGPEEGSALLGTEPSGREVGAYISFGFGMRRHFVMFATFLLEAEPGPSSI